MSVEKIKIEYKGRKILVYGEFIKGRGLIDYETPPEYDEFNITDMYIDDECVGSEYDADDFREIENLILEKLEK